MSSLSPATDAGSDLAFGGTAQSPGDSAAPSRYESITETTTDDLQDLVDALASDIGRTVAIDDPRFRLVAFSSHRQDVDQPLLTSILTREAPPAVIPRLLEFGIQRATEPMRIGGIPELGLKPRVCLPVRFDDVLLGYMWVIETETHLIDDVLNASHDAARKAAQLMYRERILGDRARARERQCVIELLDDSPETRHAAACAALDEGLLVRSSAYTVIAIEFPQSPSDSSEQSAVTVMAALERARRTLVSRGCIVGTVGSRGVLVVAVDARSDGTAVLSRITGRVRRDVQRRADGHGSLRIGQGPLVASLADVALSYGAALDAIRVAAVGPVAGDAARWDDLGAWRLLCSIPDDDRVRSSIDRGLHKLANVRGGGALLKTLECYLDHAGDARATAAELYVHRTSLYGRLRRIEREADVNLASGEDRLALHISLRLQRLMAVPSASGLVTCLASPLGEATSVGTPPG